MQVELQNNHCIFSKQLLEVIDFLVTAAPYFYWHKLLYTSNQHIFIMRAIKNTQCTLARCDFMNAPQEIVRQFLLRRSLKSMYIASLRIDVRKHMPDSAI